ncbi:ArsR/SmtB family transcription factor [Arcanobacterium canis]
MNDFDYPRAFDCVDSTQLRSTRAEVAKIVVDSLQLPVATAITMLENQSVLLDAMREEFKDLQAQVSNSATAGMNRERNPLDVFPASHEPLPHVAHASAAGSAIATAFRALDATKVSQDLNALAHPIRLEILQLTAERAMSVRELVEALSTGTTGQVYHHMKALSSAGWVEMTDGEYYLSPDRGPQLAAILAALR